MAALTKDRNTRSAWKGRALSLKVKAATTIYKGALVAVEAATGYAVPAGDTAGHIVVGVCQGIADNAAGANGAIEVEVHTGVFAVNNNGTNPAVQASVGDDAHVTDDNTIRISGSTNSIVAGKIQGIDADGQVLIFIA